MVSRKELFARLGIIDHPDAPSLHKLTIKAWQMRGDHEMENGRFRTSFWGGMFPAGIDEKHCGRKALYGLLNLPKTLDEKPSPHLLATSRAGSDVEAQITALWDKLGISLVQICHTEKQEIDPETKQPVVCLKGGIGCPVDHSQQLRLQDPRYWYSSAIDDVLDLRPEVNFVVPVDIKSKKEDVLNSIKRNQVADPKHKAQVIGYIHVCRLRHEEMGWDKMGLERSQGGFVYYVSRDNPSNAVAIWVPYVEEEVAGALALLEEWRDSFLKNQLPQRPKDWRWTENPCKFCDFKKRCKQDNKDGVTDLFESTTIKIAQRQDPDYDPEAIRQKVIERWKEEG